MDLQALIICQGSFDVRIGPNPEFLRPLNLASSVEKVACLVFGEDSQAEGEYRAQVRNE